ncbi:alkaline phosphatase family protein [Candidatus Dependentiae bacterium]|nr:alkaline phosphatase family protein [Candidatus Dependentiae bacterium]
MRKNLVSSFLIILFIHTTVFCSPPQLTIAFVVDQFAYHYLEKIQPNLTGGIKFFFDNGVIYKNAYMPHASPGTATGHVTINTGVPAKHHGVTGNYWINKEGKKIRFEQTDTEEISPEKIMVDGISDQFVLRSKPNTNHKVFGLSHKSRAAVGIAGKLGKAIWFDPKSREFVSSKAYFDKTPKWLTAFNKKYYISKAPKTLTWNLFYKKNRFAYNFYDIKNYQFSTHPFSLIDIPLGEIKNGFSGEYGELYIKTPHANQHLLDLAQTCLENNFDKEKGDRMILWISMSALDPLGHYYGPYSQEAIDMLYHIDWQIEQFMETIEKKTDPKNILYVLMADHGVMPIIEILQQKGMTNIHRINQKKLLDNLNKKIKEDDNIERLIIDYQTPQFYVDKTIFAKLSNKKRKSVSKTIKTFLEDQPGIVRVWNYDELSKMPVEHGDIDWYFKNQLYPGRSGEFTCKCSPYSAITDHTHGTHHRTPYEYDTHVPLVFHQKNVLQKKVVEKKVFMTQVANTLAKLLAVAKPSASTCEPLPGI